MGLGARILQGGANGRHLLVFSEVVCRFIGVDVAKATLERKLLVILNAIARSGTPWRPAQVLATT